MSRTTSINTLYEYSELPKWLLELALLVCAGRERQPFAPLLEGLCRRSEEVPFADGEADDLDTLLKMLPLTGNLTATVFLVSVKRLVSERPPKMVR